MAAVQFHTQSLQVLAWLGSRLALGRSSPGSLYAGSPSFVLHVEQKAFCSDILEDFIPNSSHGMVTCFQKETSVLLKAGLVKGNNYSPFGQKTQLNSK